MLFRPISLIVLGLVALGGLLAPAQATQISAVAAPTLKWQYGGCNARRTTATPAGMPRQPWPTSTATPSQG